MIQTVDNLHTPRDTYPSRCHSPFAEYLHVEDHHATKHNPNLCETFVGASFLKMERRSYFLFGTPMSITLAMTFPHFSQS